MDVQPADASWGSILHGAHRFIALGAWWLAVFPCLGIAVTAFSFNVLADITRDVLAPAARELITRDTAAKRHHDTMSRKQANMKAWRLSHSRADRLDLDEVSIPEPATREVLIPDEVSFVDPAAMTVSGGTAWQVERHHRAGD